MNADSLAQVRTDLHAAARLLLANGLHQGSFYDLDQCTAQRIPPGKARMCGYGAINTVVTGHPANHTPGDNPRLKAVHDHVYAFLFQRGLPPLIDFNDAPGRTAAQVADQLTAAAAWSPDADLSVAE